MRSHHCDSARRGQILVMFAAAFFVLCGMAVLTIDVGHLFLSKSRLQNGADAGSLAAMMEHYQSRSDGATRGTARGEGSREGGAIADINYSGLGYEATWGRWENQQFVHYDSSTPANAVKLRVYRDSSAPAGPVGTFFAGILGRDTMDQDAEAVAHFENPGLVPFAVFEDDIPPVGDEMIFYNDTELAPGVFGLLNFDGGSNSADDLKLWTDEGWDGDAEIDPEVGYVLINGSTGLKSSLHQAISDHIGIGDVVVGCIYDRVEGQANDATFYVVGFVSLVITDQKLDREEYEYIKGEVMGTYYGESGFSTGTMRRTVRLHLVQ